MESQSHVHGTGSHSLAEVRKALISPEFPDDLPADVSLAFRRDAAFVLLTDFHDSVQAARENAPRARAVLSSGSTALSGGASAPSNAPATIGDKLTMSDFPPLAGEPVGKSKASRKARKRITPSRVSLSEVSSTSSSFAGAPAWGATDWKQKELFPALTSRRGPSKRSSSAGVSGVSDLPDSDSRASQPLASLANRKPRGGAPPGGTPPSSTLRVPKKITADALVDNKSAVPDPTADAPSVHVTCEIPAISVDPDLKPLLECENIKRISSMHAVFVLQAVSSEHSTSEMLIVLADALCLSTTVEGDQGVRKSPARGIFARLDNAYSTGSHLCAHAVLTFALLKPLLCLLPSPLVNAIAGNRILRTYAPTTFQGLSGVTPYPIPNNSLGFAFAEYLSTNGSTDFSWDSISSSDSPVEPSPRHRLSGNLEASWDKLIDLHRLYRGDNSQVPAGTLDRFVSTKTLSDLHPANVDAFAGRLLKLLLQSAAPRQDDLDRRARLSLRMTSSRDPSTSLRPGRFTPAAARSSKFPGHADSSKSQNGHDSGVVLHRVPPAVRTLYHVGSSEAFFLDFMDVVDSSKLKDAIIPRLSLALHNFLKDATTAQSEESFVDAVLLARVSAKLLAVPMHSSNWAFSSHSLSCEATVARDHQRANKLPMVVSQRRAALSSAVWKSCVDVSSLLHKAIATEHGPTVFAVVTVADLLLRVAAMDSLSSTTDWFTSCLDVLFDLLRSSHLHGEDEYAWLTSTPAIRFAIEDLLLSLPASHAHVPLVGVGIRRDRWFELPAMRVGDKGIIVSSFGDERLLATCSPNLATLKRILGSGNGTRVQNSVKLRRIRPSLTSVSSEEPDRESTATGMLTSSDADRMKDRTEMGITFSAPTALNFVAGDSSAGESAVSLAIRRELWLTFQRGLDKRVRDVVHLVLQKKDMSKVERSVTMKRAAELLLPDISVSVVEVIAQHCAQVPGIADTPDRNANVKDNNFDSTPKDTERLAIQGDSSGKPPSDDMKSPGPIQAKVPLPQLMTAAWSSTSPEGIRKILLKTPLKVSSL